MKGVSAIHPYVARSGDANDPRPVVVLVHAFPTRSETFVSDHIIGLQRAGWRVVVLADEVDEQLLSELSESCGLRVEARAIRPSWHVASRRIRTALATAVHLWHLPSVALTVPYARVAALWVRDLRRVLVELNPVLLHAHFGTNGLRAALARGRRRYPVVVDFHGFDVTAMVREGGWRSYRRLLTRPETTAVCHSSFVEKRLRAHMDMRVLHIPIGVDTDAFRSPVRQSTWRTPLRLLFVGRLVEQKGAATAVEALALLRRKRPDLPAELRIVGDGPQRPFLGALARRLNVRDTMELVGAVPYRQVAAEMRQADVLLVPSRLSPNGAVEAFGRVALEGTAAGLPVVASPVGGLPESVGSAGTLARDLTAAGLVEAVEKVLARPPDEWATRAREHAARFTIDRMHAAYADLVRAATSRPD